MQKFVTFLTFLVKQEGKQAYILPKRLKNAEICPYVNLFGEAREDIRQILAKKVIKMQKYAPVLTFLVRQDGKCDKF